MKSPPVWLELTEEAPDEYKLLELAGFFITSQNTSERQRLSNVFILFYFYEMLHFSPFLVVAGLGLDQAQGEAGGLPRVS